MLGSNLVNLVIRSKYTVISDYTMYEQDLAGLSLFAGSGNFFHFDAMDFWLVFARF